MEGYFMNITEYKGILENIVHDSLYVLDRHSDKQEEYLNEMIEYLSKSEDYFNEIMIQRETKVLQMMKDWLKNAPSDGISADER